MTECKNNIKCFVGGGRFTTICCYDCENKEDCSLQCETYQNNIGKENCKLEAAK
jgi:hypothetical protein